MVTHADQVLDATATQEHYRVFLQIMTLAGYVGGNFHPVGEADTGDFAERRVRLLRSGSGDFGANPALKGRRKKDRLVLKDVEATGEGNGLVFTQDFLSPMPY